jgi:AhpD family alkylhydroperoxidase
MARRQRELAPEVKAAFEAFGRQVFAGGALDAKTKQLTTVAVAQCPYCIQGHTKAAQRAGAVAAEMRAGAVYAHAAIMLASLSEDR